MAITLQPYDAQHLPFSTVRFVKKDTAFQFDVQIPRDAQYLKPKTPVQVGPLPAVDKKDAGAAKKDSAAVKKDAAAAAKQSPDEADNDGDADEAQQQQGQRGQQQGQQQGQRGQGAGRGGAARRRRGRGPCTSNTTWRQARSTSSTRTTARPSGRGGHSSRRTERRSSSPALTISS